MLRLYLKKQNKYIAQQRSQDFNSFFVKKFSFKLTCASNMLISIVQNQYH